MSLFGALSSGVSGLTSQSSAMGAISDNITNVSTVGYKNTRVNFQSLVTKQTSATFYSAGGVQSKPRQDTGVQGLLQASTSQTDLALSGNGFFVVNEASLLVLSIIRNVATTNNIDIAPSPDTVAAALIWLASAIVLEKPLTHDKLKVISSLITLKRAINNLLKERIFLVRISKEMPSDYVDDILALGAKVVTSSSLFAVEKSSCIKKE